MLPCRVSFVCRVFFVIFSFICLKADGAVSPEVEIAPPVIVALGGNADLQSLSAGEGGPAYEWRLNGKVLAGETGEVLKITGAKVGDAGTYRVRTTDGHVTEIRVAVYESINRQMTFFPGRPLVLMARAWGPGIAYRWGFSESWEARGTGTARLTLNGSLTRSLGEGAVEAYLIIEGMEILVASYDLVRAPQSMPPEIRVAGLPSHLVLGASYASPVLVESDSAFTATAAGLPPGLAYDAVTGLINGTPTKLGEYEVRIQARNKTGAAEAAIWQVGITAQAGTDYGPGGRFFGAFNVEFLETSGKHQTTPDLVVVDMTRSGQVTGYVQIGPKRASFAGGMVKWEFPPLVISRFRPFVLKGLPSPNSVTLTLDQRLTGQGGVAFTAELAGLTSYQTVTLHREIKPTQRELQNLGGRHSVLLSSPSSDAGSGFGSLTFPGGKTARMAGTLPDGSSFTVSSPLLRDSQTQAPRFEVKYWTAKDSRFTGYVTGDGNGLSGYVRWSKPLNEKERILVAFPVADFVVVGCRSFAPAPGMIALPYALPRPNNVWLQLGSDGSLTSGVGAEIWQPFTLTTGHRAIFPKDQPYQLRLDLYAPTGFFTGSFVLNDPNPLDENRTIRRSVAFRGITVPSLGVAEGFFLLPQLPDPSAEPPTTMSTSPIYSGKVSFGSNY